MERSTELAGKMTIDKIDVETTYIDVRTAIDRGELEGAAKILRKVAAERDVPAHILDKLAEVEMSLGEIPSAAKAWMSAIEASCDPCDPENAERCLYLAQLQEGDTARHSYLQGIEMLHVRLSCQTSSDISTKKYGPSDEIRSETSVDFDSIIKAQLCTAYCALAELYLTDLCFELDAERSCQTALDQSMQYNMTNSHEPIQGLASLRLSQGLHEEASQLMHVAFERILDAQKSESPIETEVRLAAVRLLLECAPHAPSCAENAVELLSTLMQEDDENIEVWFLMGVALFQQAPPDLLSAKRYLLTASQMLDSVKQSMQTNEGVYDFPYGVQELLVKSQIEEIDRVWNNENGHMDGVVETFANTSSFSKYVNSSKTPIEATEDKECRVNEDIEELFVMD